MPPLPLGNPPVATECCCDRRAAACSPARGVQALAAAKAPTTAPAILAASQKLCEAYDTVQAPREALVVRSQNSTLAASWARPQGPLALLKGSNDACDTVAEPRERPTSATATRLSIPRALSLLTSPPVPKTSQRHIKMTSNAPEGPLRGRFTRFRFRPPSLRGAAPRLSLNCELFTSSSTHIQYVEAFQIYSKHTEPEAAPAAVPTIAALPYLLNHQQRHLETQILSSAPSSWVC